MKLRFNLIGLAVAASMATVGLQAQDTTFSAKFGLYSSQGDLRKGYTQITGGPTSYRSVPVLETKAMGMGIELGWDLKPSPELGIGTGVYAGWQRFDANKDVPWGADAKGTFIGVDLIYQVPSLPLTVRTGPMVTSWDITQKTGVNPVTQLPQAGNTGSLGETTWKLGWRVGMEYKASKHCTVGLLYGLSTWKTAINPSYLALQAGYQFNL